MKHNILICIKIIPVLFILFCGKNDQKTPRQEQASVPSVKVSGENAEKAILNLADSVLHFIANKNWEQLSTFIHPKRGLGFTTEAFVDTTLNIRFSAREIRKLKENKNHYQWGSDDATGEEIKLSFEDYYRHYLYDKDYAKMRRGNPNQQVGGGNTVNNILTIFAERKISFVEYHFPGTAQTHQMDWSSLRLVFEKIKNKWFLIYLVHDQWSS